MARQFYIASDHAGLPLKEKLLELKNYNWKDLGTHTEASVDYPDFAHELASAMKDDPDSMGVLVCGSGQGMAMAANEHKHIRAALCWNKELARLSREHNNANVLCLGARVIDHDLALEIFSTFVHTEFEGGRHEKRVSKI